MRSTLLLGTGLVGMVGVYAYGGNQMSGVATFEGGGFRCSVSEVTDGDTLRCVEAGADGRAIRVRLSGIAARETDGSCSPGHPCPIASAEAATAELSRLAAGQVLGCQAVGETYGRVAAFCRTAGGVDLSCAMVASGTVERWQRYWGGHRCPAR